MPKKEKYYYNLSTHRFEKVEPSLKMRLLQVFGFVAGTLVAAGLIIAIAFKFMDSPKEKLLKSELYKTREKLRDLQGRVQLLDKELAKLEKKDNTVYRAVFEAAPVAQSDRAGKDAAADSSILYTYEPDEVILHRMSQKVNSLMARVTFQDKSYDTLLSLVNSKEKMLASIPAIVPVSGKDFAYLASGFGYRIDPVYKTLKMHNGLDFAAPTGTPIYATADGQIKTTGFDDMGYGNYVVINHGYNYETLYAHMIKVKAKQGQRVKRGEVIGWVGSTGKSTGAHCHYEVIKNGAKTDPIHFFFNDLSAAEYEVLIQQAQSSNQSFD